jgi:hypothetical protein
MKTTGSPAKSYQPPSYKGIGLNDVPQTPGLTPEQCVTEYSRLAAKEILHKAQQQNASEPRVAPSHSTTDNKARIVDPRLS